MARVAGAAGTQAKRLGLPSVQGVEVHASAMWVLIGLELLTLVGLRRYFSRHHGG